MGEQTQTQHVVLNPREQPVELVLPERSVVIPPRGRLVLSDEEVGAPHVRVLLRHRLLVRQLGVEQPTSSTTPERDAKHSGRN